MITIKKHENRKLYNTKTHKYTNLTEIKNLVKSGESVLIKNYSGEDITLSILKRIIEKCELKRDSLLEIIKNS